MRYLQPILALLLATSCAAQEREWSWDMTDQDAFLVFGTPNTDDVGVSFWCNIGSGKIKIYAHAQQGAGKAGTGLMKISASGKEFQLSYRPSRSSAGSPASIESEVSVGNALFAALADANQMEITIKGHETHFPLADADIALLTKTCGKR